MTNKMNPFTGEVLEFTCMICGKWRLDEYISVYTQAFMWSEDGTIIGEENIRYCNDTKGCILYAKNYNEFKQIQRNIKKEEIQ